jgi:hypothetical protein
MWKHWGFLLVMAVGSIIGTFIGGQLLGLVPNAVLLPLRLTAAPGPANHYRLEAGYPVSGTPSSPRRRGQAYKFPNSLAGGRVEHVGYFAVVEQKA